MSRQIPQAEIDAAKAARPDRRLVILTPDDDDRDEFLFAVPKAAEYQKFRTMVLDDETKAGALRVLVDGCVITPSPAEFALITQDHPGFNETFGGQLLRLAGAGVGVTVKKV